MSDIFMPKDAFLTEDDDTYNCSRPFKIMNKEAVLATEGEWRVIQGGIGTDEETVVITHNNGMDSEGSECPDCGEIPPEKLIKLYILLGGGERDYEW